MTAAIRIHCLLGHPGQVLMTSRICQCPRHHHWSLSWKSKSAHPSRTSWSGVSDTKDVLTSFASLKVAFLDIQVDPPFQDILVECGAMQRTFQHPLHHKK